jgi:hypothetical protein
MWLIPGEDARLLREIVNPPRRQTIYGRCTFCGHLCFGRVCRAHRDLLDLEAEPLAPQRENTSGSDQEEGTR